MSRVTSKLQVTLPKAIAERHGIAPGDEIEWESAGDVIRIVPASRRAPSGGDISSRLRLFDQATRRQEERNCGFDRRDLSEASRHGRGWSRLELYERGRPR